MRLPKCWSCQYEFKWKEVLVVIEGRTTCPKCKEKQYTTTHSKWRNGVLFLPTLLIGFIPILFSFSLLLQFSLILVIFLVSYLFTPYQLEFTDRPQPLF